MIVLWRIIPSATLLMMNLFAFECLSRRIKNEWKFRPQCDLFALVCSIKPLRKWIQRMTFMKRRCRENSWIKLELSGNNWSSLLRCYDAFGFIVIESIAELARVSPRPTCWGFPFWSFLCLASRSASVRLVSRVTYVLICIKHQAYTHPSPWFIVVCIVVRWGGLLRANDRDLFRADVNTADGRHAQRNETNPKVDPRRTRRDLGRDTRYENTVDSY